MMATSHRQMNLHRWRWRSSSDVTRTKTGMLHSKSTSVTLKSESDRVYSN